MKGRTSFMELWDMPFSFVHELYRLCQMQVDEQRKKEEEEEKKRQAEEKQKRNADSRFKPPIGNYNEIKKKNKGHRSVKKEELLADVNNNKSNSSSTPTSTTSNMSPLEAAALEDALEDITGGGMF